MEEAKEAIPRDSAAKSRHWVAPRSNKRIGIWIAASTLFAAAIFQEEISDMFSSSTGQTQSNTDKSLK